MYKELLDEILKHEYITIFRHLRPDGDCIFAQNALSEYIKYNFKGKKVKCIGHDAFNIYNHNDKASDNFIKNSLAIIVDCSNEERTDDNRYNLAKKRIIIDHHPGHPIHGEIAIVDTSVSATCELLTKIFYSKEFSKYKITPKICKLLYCGILTDSMSFSTSNTTALTLYYGSKLITDGKFKPSDLNDYVFSSDYDYFKKISLVRNYFKIDNGVGYVILNQNDLDKIGMDFVDAKNCIDEFSNIDEAKIWSVFSYNKATGFYEGSIRSKRKYIINNLCQKYNGGGHPNACGVKKMTIPLIEEFIQESIKIVNC